MEQKTHKSNSERARRWVTFSPDRGVWVVVNSHGEFVRTATAIDINEWDRWEER